jgi:hypothetical protein
MESAMFYKYTGDIKVLKNYGYTFQKLYARNYKSYHKGEIFMFVVSKMEIEITNIPHVPVNSQEIVIDFILTNKDKPVEFWEYEGLSPFNKKLAKYRLINGEILTTEERYIKYPIKDNVENLFIEEFRLDIKLVNQILELNSIKPLEKTCK